MAWFHLFTRHRSASTPRQPSWWIRLEELESRVEYLTAELKKLRGRVYAQERGDRQGQGSGAEERIAGDEAPTQPPAHWPVTRSDHLAARFRLGG